MSGNRILVLGASGYIGTRLVERLVSSGHRIRAVARNADRLRIHTWSAHPAVEIFSADLLNYDQIKAACTDCSVVYYLVHSMLSRKKDFAEADRRAASNVSRAAEESGIERIIYLSGLADEGADLGEHLRSRAEVARILRSGKVPVTVLRAAMIIGAGSGSFEIMRYLVERLPVMVTPKWVYTKSQPISIRNVIGYLAGCLDARETVNGTFDIGGPDILSYRELFNYYAREAKLKERMLVRVPLFTPKMSSYWVALFTPVPLALIKPLLDGLRIRAVCDDNRIMRIIPQELLGCREAIRSAIDPRQDFIEFTLQKVKDGTVPFEWSRPGDPRYSGGQVFTSSLSLETDLPPEVLWEPLRQISEELSCCYNETLWKLWRNADDYAGRLAFNLGMPGAKPGSEKGLFWRTVDVKPGKRLVIIAEVEIFGWMLLEFTLERIGEDRTRLRLNVKFHTRGVQGIAYWVATFPLHQAVFSWILNWVADCLGKECRISFSTAEAE
jgi:uncharacterized protein YbjT (DUF2867 family)